MVAIIAFFFMGVAVDSMFALWVHYVERARLAPAVYMAWGLGGFGLLSARVAVLDPACAVAYAFGLGIGTGGVILWKRARGIIPPPQ